jgi:hypothetical protein
MMDSTESNRSNDGFVKEPEAKIQVISMHPLLIDQYNQSIN